MADQEVNGEKSESGLAEGEGTIADTCSDCTNTAYKCLHCGMLTCVQHCYTISIDNCIHQDLIAGKVQALYKNSDQELDNRQIYVCDKCPHADSTLTESHSKEDYKYMITILSLSLMEAYWLHGVAVRYQCVVALFSRVPRHEMQVYSKVLEALGDSMEHVKFDIQSHVKIHDLPVSETIKALPLQAPSHTTDALPETRPYPDYTQVKFTMEQFRALAPKKWAEYWSHAATEELFSQYIQNRREGSAMYKQRRQNPQCTNYSQCGYLCDGTVVDFCCAKCKETEGNSHCIDCNGLRQKKQRDKDSHSGHRSPASYSPPSAPRSVSSSCSRDDSRQRRKHRGRSGSRSRSRRAYKSRSRRQRDGSWKEERRDRRWKRFEPKDNKSRDHSEYWYQKRKDDKTKNNESDKDTIRAYNNKHISRCNHCANRCTFMWHYCCPRCIKEPGFHSDNCDQAPFPFALESTEGHGTPPPPTQSGRVIPPPAARVVPPAIKDTSEAREAPTTPIFVDGVAYYPVEPPPSSAGKAQSQDPMFKTKHGKTVSASTLLNQTNNKMSVMQQQLDTIIADRAAQSTSSSTKKETKKWMKGDNSKAYTWDEFYEYAEKHLNGQRWRRKDVPAYEIRNMAKQLWANATRA